ncbi:Transglutaminase-like superfamily protein [Aquimixticola soesokkakensis]|uniref:Transglutaminase-like superfamily protein n=1 Tax=Aquimixticola soesokkakensis TaxID=1519096 RepID=A0A1Y5T6C4_9RHOB|nr:transglutaminase family protein [Aquimixticola soesokkakensis]SLN56911.1 Transglutaminase-like superfamily protein [Aquimixticola soesokkakensis]
MRFLIDVHMDYQLAQPETALLAIEAAQCAGQTLCAQSLDLGGASVQRIACAQNIGERIWADVDVARLDLRYRAEVEVTRPAVTLSGRAANGLPDLPAGVLPYVRPSRFCQSDLFATFVEQSFGTLEGGDKVAAILDWVRGHMAYVPGSSNAATTATDSFVARQGVCRDYTHLVCALARAANIPARYASVYGADVSPPDFHAVAEVWLEDAWHLVDATGMCQAQDLVVICVGRDAADVAFLETRDWAQPLTQTVSVTRA